MKKNYLSKLAAACKSMMLLCGMAGMVLTFSACSDDDEPAYKGKSITVIMSKLGAGNHDYCSLIADAIVKWEKSGKVDMKVYWPHSNEEAENLYRNWAKETAGSDAKSLMVVANGEYEQMVNSVDLKLGDRQQVLAFETPLKPKFKNVHTFEIIHNGVAYLAGTMASLSGQACVIVGYATPRLQHASDHFADGFKKYVQKDCPMLTLASGYQGFNMVGEARKIAEDPRYKDHFILPLAGLSNEGVYGYLDECIKTNSDNKMLSCGVDVDLNKRNKRIAFSYLIHIDKAVDMHLECWLNGKPWPEAPLGLAKGMTDVKINPDFEPVGKVTKEGLKRLYDENLEEAKKKD